MSDQTANLTALSGDEVAMVCDAYGLPHSAVALARHLANNADHAHSVNMHTIGVLKEQLDESRRLYNECFWSGCHKPSVTDFHLEDDAGNPTWDVSACAEHKPWS